MNIQRDYLDRLENLKKIFPIIAVIWARQVWKTTFLKEQFKDYEYYNLESPATLELVKKDPEGFLKQRSHIIIDEIQKCPILFSCFLEIVDSRDELADFIISWSENLLLSEKISQSLAWRVWYLNMEAFSFSELSKNNLLADDFVEQMFKWFLPRIYDKQADPVEYYDQYIATYLERDVRQIKSVHDLWLFQKFIALLAGRIGQMINYTSLADDVWVEKTTITRWISILEASYLAIELHPYYENFGKRYIKSPKIYFTDTWLASRLLWINSVEELRKHHIVWNLFENMMVMETIKQINIRWTKERIYFYRDSKQNEVDVIIDKANSQIPIEIKSGSSFSRDYAKWINYWYKLNENNTNKKPDEGIIIYTWDS